MRPTVFREPSGHACNSYQLWREDVGLVAGLGLDTYRFSVEWARVEPAEGQFSAEALAHYRAIIDHCLAAGIAPVVTYNHFTSPHWFARRGGWFDPRAPTVFARYCDVVTERLGDGIAWAVTLNEPNLPRLLSTLQDVTDGVLTRRLDGSGDARGAQQAEDGVVHGDVAPAAHDLAIVDHPQAGVRHRSLQVARRRQGVRSVVIGSLGRDERVHGQVHDGALGALGRREQAGDHAALRAEDTGRFAQRPARVAGELERVDADHGVEGGGVEGGGVERQGLHVAFAQVGIGQPRWAARTSVSPEPQPTSSTRVPGPAPAASSTASNSGWLCASARSAQARGSVPHRRRWTSAAALTAGPPLMPRSQPARCSG